MADASPTSPVLQPVRYRRVRPRRPQTPRAFVKLAAVTSDATSQTQLLHNRILQLQKETQLNKKELQAVQKQAAEARKRIDVYERRLENLSARTPAVLGFNSQGACQRISAAGMRAQS